MFQWVIFHDIGYAVAASKQNLTFSTLRLAANPACYTTFYDKLKNDPGWTVHTLPGSHSIQKIRTPAQFDSATRRGARERRAASLVEASAEADFEKASASLASLQAGALVVGADRSSMPAALKLSRWPRNIPCPTIYEWREFVDASGLISYGTSLAEVYRQIGTYVGRYSVAKSPPICQSSNRPPSSWSSISRSPRRSI